MCVVFFFLLYLGKRQEGFSSQQIDMQFICQNFRGHADHREKAYCQGHLLNFTGGHCHD